MVHIYHIFIIPLLVKGHLGCFQFHGVIKRAEKKNKRTKEELNFKGLQMLAIMLTSSLLVLSLIR